ncbi:MAG: AAC(3) family N-acetyltransferase [Chloroflexi bacterium]|nr:AAC(3) family N-acetyltransferase [Anaerolineaceae bacterium]NMB90490.1 AAC(3) family N-acetyltransferase [Chloroflexota bacterium]
MTVSYREIVSGLRQLNLNPSRPVIVHASLSSFGEVRGGVETLLGALLGSVEAVMAPSFTYKTMLIPETGPENNGLAYGSGKDANRMAEFFRPDMPADPLMGVLPEALRKHPAARRSGHPILSFCGVNVPAALAAQSLAEPLAPVRVLYERDGWVLLLGVNHTVNTSIHYAEQLAGRKSFTRWALTLNGIRECPHFPSCSLGFEAAAPLFSGITHTVQIGDACVQALPLQAMVTRVVQYLKKDPAALLCSDAQCERCNAVRAELAGRTV